MKNNLEDSIWSLKITSDDNFIVTGSADRSIKIFHIATKQQVHVISNAHAGKISTFLEYFNTFYRDNLVRRNIS